MSEPQDQPDLPDAPPLTEGERQAQPGKPAGVMSHQDPRRQHDLDGVLGRREES